MTRCAPLLLLALGCASTVSHVPLAPGEEPPGPPKAVQTEEKEVTDCEFVDTLTGKAQERYGLRYVNYLLAQVADQVGATHYVITDVQHSAGTQMTTVDAGFSNVNIPGTPPMIYATAKAYRCEAEEDATEPTAD